MWHTDDRTVMSDETLENTAFAKMWKWLPGSVFFLPITFCILAWCNILKRTQAPTYSVSQLLVNRHTAAVLQKRHFLAGAIRPCCFSDLRSVACRQSGWHLISTLFCWINSKWHTAQLFVSAFVIADNRNPPLNKYKSAENNRWARCSVTFWNITPAISFYSRSPTPHTHTHTKHERNGWRESP